MRFPVPLLLSLFMLVPALLSADQIAFPGAEGFGRFASGGRGGEVIAVTNLNDDGPGSLRAAVEAEGPRTIVFRVSGTIFLESNLEIKNGDLTIAGQTAPGDGITLANYSLKLEGENVIIRFIRSRLGDRESAQADAFEARYVTNAIVDHCTFSWAIDETATAYNNKDFTMQWCIVSEGLHNSVHEKGNHGYGGIWGGKNATFHHNLIAHSRSRTPRFNGARYEDYAEWGDGRVDHRNNVIYNWGDNSAYGAESHASGFRPQYNLIGNVYKPGPATQDSKRDRIINPDPGGSGAYGQFFIWGNYVFDAPETSLDNWEGVDGVPSETLDSLRAEESFAVGYRRNDWELLRFPHDEDGDGELDIFEGYTGVEVDPVYDSFLTPEGGLPRFDLASPELLVTLLRGEQVSSFDELSQERQELFTTWTGYYEDAGAVYVDGTLFVASEFTEPLDSESAFASELQYIRTPQTIFPALEAYEQVLAHAGASFPHRDSVDLRVVEEVRTGTAAYGNDGHIDSQTEVGGYPDLQSAPAPEDSDGDGMPDDWEIDRGLDPNDASDRNDDGNGNGYTNLEDYLNGLVADHFPTAYSATYADWVAAAFWDDDSAAGLLDDPDDDGRVNAFEYALVSDPRRADVPPGALEVSTPALYDFTYRLGADLDIAIESTGNFDNWSTLWSADEPERAHPVPLQREPGMHTARLKLDFTPHPERSDSPLAPLFWRLTVRENEPEAAE